MGRPPQSLVDVVLLCPLPSRRRSLDSTKTKQASRLPRVTPPDKRPSAVHAEEGHGVDGSLRVHTVAIGVAKPHHDLVANRILDRRTDARVGPRGWRTDAEALAKRNRCFTNGGVERLGQFTHCAPRRPEVGSASRGVERYEQPDDLRVIERHGPPAAAFKRAGAPTPPHLAIQRDTGGSQRFEVSLNGSPTDLELLSQGSGRHQTRACSPDALADGMQSFRPLHGRSCRIERRSENSDTPLSHWSSMLALMTEQNTPRLAWIIVYVTELAPSLDLYTTAFGLTVAFEHPGGDYAEFATGPTALALCTYALAAESTRLSLEGENTPRSNITLVVDDVPAAFERALNAGATPIAEPVTKPWGQASSYVADLDGNLVELASPVAAS